MPVRVRVVPAALAAALLAGCGSAAGGAPSPPAPRPTTPGERSVAPSRPVQVTYPREGTGAFSAARAEKDPGGGSALRYRVLVEKDIKGISPGTFAATVRATLADPRGWTAGGDREFRRVGAREPYDFTIYLVTPATRDELCQDVPDGYTSCRNGDRVVLNVARWVKGVPGYGAPLSVYRQYMVNHEVGHRLGQGHERCPGRGRPAPVMQQQTLGLHGCTANPWPYREGERYAGASGVYDDRMPPPDRGSAR
ncbi:DUF3152 domain-containing protein [Pseudosporangium ferrugineum]|uniref:Uncharacterized protein DUF3152 n=1 Tax=Pseudosporangium ferrugineum TaxID=439699 RepID=A0A2T0RKM5_9ACTN|nr:DUF3152 domain-containing protein [Pseudosporangium ferrugineum]PRY21670.1 uncharacterized protein DUF3152 [Pseudosporangium ferrugineum]